MLINHNEFNTAIKTLTKSLTKSKELIQQAAVFAIACSLQKKEGNPDCSDRNTDPATRLIQATQGKGVFQQTLVAFMESFGQLEYKAGDKKHLPKFILKENAELPLFDEDKLMAIDWAIYKAQTTVSMHSAQKDFRNFVNRMTTWRDEGRMVGLDTLDGSFFGLEGKTNIVEVLNILLSNYDDAQKKANEDKKPVIVEEEEVVVQEQKAA